MSKIIQSYSNFTIHTNINASHYIVSVGAKFKTDANSTYL